MPIFSSHNIQFHWMDGQCNDFMAQEELKHRIKLPLYDIEPKIENCWIAPNSVVVGEVYMRRWSSVWYNSVVRGDINKVEI